MLAWNAFDTSKKFNIVWLKKLYPFIFKVWKFVSKFQTWTDSNFGSRWVTKNIINSSKHDYAM